MRHIVSKEVGSRCVCFLLATIGFSVLTPSHAYAGEEYVKRNRFLVLDSRLIESVKNAKLALGTLKKHPANPLFTEDKPWEKRFDNLYGNVIYDKQEKVYKCWYSPFIVDRSAKGMSLKERRKKRYSSPRGREMGICYAISKDGIHWEKPNLGLVEYEGSKKNNIIWRGPHGAGVFKDPHDPDTGSRYKMIFKGLKVSTSADGIHWSEPRRLEGVKVAGDTHNNALWAPTLGKYVGFTRTWGKKGREVMRIESNDFKTWRQDQVVMRAADKKRQPYAMPVFYYGGVYLGLVAVHHQPPVDRVWTELAWSPDTVTWHRVCEGTELIPCAEKPLEYDYGCVYACAYPVFLEDEIRLYYGGSDYLHYGWRVGSLCLATLRPDGFAGYEQAAAGDPALITTVPITCNGKQLQVTSDVQKGGAVTVKLLDKNGASVLAVSAPVRQTVTDRRVIWENNFSMGDMKGGEVRLQFKLEDAKLYSFGFDLN